MHSTHLLLALASAVTATNPLLRRVVEARQTGSATDADAATATDDAACTSAAEALEDLINTAPTPAPELGAYASASPEALGDDPCLFTFPSSLLSDWSVYSAEVYSWYSATVSVAVASVLDVCDAETTLGPADLGLCSTDADAVAASTGGAEATGTEATTKTTSGAAGLTTSTATGTSAAAEATTTATSGAVAREAGLVGVVLAGILGAVVAL